MFAIAADKYGEEIVCVYAGAPSQVELESYPKAKMSSYKVPRVWRKVEKIQRNQMGKISKKQIRQLYFS